MSNTRKHQLLVDVEAPSHLSPNQVAELVNFIINAGLSDAADSEDLPECDRTGPVNDALALQITEPTALVLPSIPERDMTGFRYSAVSAYMNNQTDEQWREMLDYIARLEGIPGHIANGTRIIELGQHGQIVLELDGHGGGTVSSNLKSYHDPACNNAIGGMEMLILAHARVGVNVQHGRYADGVRDAVRAVTEHEDEME